MNAIAKGGWRRVGLVGALLVSLTGLGGCAPSTPPLKVPFEPLRPGLDWAEFTLPGDPEGEPSMIEVLRVDPARFELRLLSANSMPGHGPRTPDRWLEDMHAIAVLNASMYMTDGLTSVALMRSRGRVNNPTLGRGMAVVLADPRESGLPPARIAEMDRPGFDSLLAQYRTAVQDLRIIASSPMPHVVWKGSAQTWSQAAIGQDAAGRILFLYSRAPHNPARLGNALLHTDLQLRVLAHVEGSSPAALALSVGRLRKVWYGERSSPLDAASGAEAVPNVFAVFPR